MRIRDYYKKKFVEESLGETQFLEINSLEKLKKLSDQSIPVLSIDGLLNQSLEYEETLKLAKQKLTAGGTLLVFAGSIAPALDGQGSLWGFTLASANFIFQKYFDSESFKVTGFGNVLVGRVLLTGGQVSDLSQEELDLFDPYYPVFLGVKAIKK